MTGRARALRLLAATCFALGLVCLLPAGGHAAEPTVTGWWHRDVPLSGGEPGASAAVAGQSAGTVTMARLSSSALPSQVPPPPTLPPLPLPPPPTVTIPDPGGPGTPTPNPGGDDALLVANDVTGVRAMAALRFDAPGAGGATLELKLATGSVGAANVLACPALSDWQPGPDQPWSARPAHDCDRISTSPTIGTDGVTLTWELPADFRAADTPDYDVLLVPLAEDSNPFTASFEKPGTGAFEVTSPFPEPTLPPDVPLPDDIPPPIDSFNPDGFDPGALPPVDPGAGPTEAPPSADPRPSVVQRAASVLENPTVRRIAAAALIAIGAYAYWQSNQSVQRAPRLLGALSQPQAAVAGAIAMPIAARGRGIGRFARDRSRPPTRL